MRYKFTIMFLMVLCGTISIATFNPLIGPLARNLGLSEIQAGSLVTITGICWIVGGFLWGKWTLLGRKNMLTMVSLIYVVTLVVFGIIADSAAAFSGNTWTLYFILLVLRAAAGFFFGAIPAKAQAYVLNWTTRQTRSAGLALVGAANGLGFVLGPAMGGALSGIRLTAPMYTAAGLLFAVTLIFVITIHENGEEEKSAQKNTLSLLDGRIRFYLLIGLLLSTVLIMMQVTIGFFLQDQLAYQTQKTAQVVGAGLTVAGVMVVVVQVLVTKVLRWGPNTLLRVGLPLLGCGFIGLLVATQIYMLDFIILGVGIGCTMLGYTTSASLSVNETEQDSVASFLSSIQGVGSFLGPLIGTYLYTFHLTLPYWICVMMICLVLPNVYRKKRAGNSVSS